MKIFIAEFEKRENTTWKMLETKNCDEILEISQQRAIGIKSVMTHNDMQKKIYFCTLFE